MTNSTSTGNLVVKSTVKNTLKGLECNTASDALEGLEKVVKNAVEQAAARAKANGRKTVRSHDFWT